jgi:hypothetical protein
MTTAATAIVEKCNSIHHGKPQNLYALNAYKNKQNPQTTQENWNPQSNPNKNSEYVKISSKCGREYIRQIIELTVTSQRCKARKPLLCGIYTKTEHVITFHRIYTLANTHIYHSNSQTGPLSSTMNMVSSKACIPGCSLFLPYSP